MDDTGLMQLVGRVRRGTVNPDILTLCNALERYILAFKRGEAKAKPKFDKKSYMREYMRKRRKCDRDGRLL